MTAEPDFRGIHCGRINGTPQVKRSQRRIVSVFTWMTMVCLSSVSTGCGATLGQLQTRAALDLDCTPTSITARDIDRGTVVASGCGKQAIYIEHCVGDHHSHCTWMLNSAIKSAASQ